MIEAPDLTPGQTASTTNRDVAVPSYPRAVNANPALVRPLTATHARITDMARVVREQFSAARPR